MLINVFCEFICPSHVWKERNFLSQERKERKEKKEKKEKKAFVSLSLVLLQGNVAFHEKDIYSNLEYLQ